MSDLFSQVKSKSISLRKEKHVLSSELVFLISSINSTAKETKTDVTDDMVVKAIRSQVKKMNETISLAKDTDTSEIKNGIDLLQSFLPKETSKEEIISFTEGLIGEQEKSVKLMGKIMSGLKQNYGASLNDATAAQIIKQYLME